MARKDWRPDVYHPGEHYDEEEWGKLRLRVIKRDRYKCYRCGKRSKTTVGLSAHHIVPRKEGGQNNLENLITLCNPCHDYVEEMEFRTLQEIFNSVDDSPIEMADDGEIKITKKDQKTNWRLWVYGGLQPPRPNRVKKTKSTRQQFIEDFIKKINQDKNDL